MGKNDQIFPHHPQNVYRERQLDLFDKTLGRNEHRTRIVYHVRNKEPHDEADCEIRKIRGNIQTKETPIQGPHSANQGTRADSQPERPENRSSIALLDFEPTQHWPDVDTGNAVFEILDRQREMIAIAHLHGAFDLGNFTEAGLKIRYLKILSYSV